MTKSNILIFSILFFLGFHLTSFAQQKSSELKKLSKEAEVIVTGKVIHKKSSWNDSKTRIYTKTTLQIDEYLKGDFMDSAVEISSLGGEVNGIGEFYSHMPSFKDDEKVLVFLKKDKKNNSYKVLHGEEGKIALLKNGKTKSMMTSSTTQLKSLISQIKSYLKK